MEAGNISIRYTDAGQESEDIQNVARSVQEILTAGEEILYICRQTFNAGIQRDSVIATSNRLIIYEPQIFGRFNFRDYLWRDVHDAQLSQGVLSSELAVRTRRGVERIGNLDKEQARRVYTVCQQQEEEWLERRRERDLEEARARSGGYVVQPPAGAPATPAPADDPVAKLAQLKAMLDQGLISEAEYNEVKARVLQSL